MPSLAPSYVDRQSARGEDWGACLPFTWEWDAFSSANRRAHYSRLARIFECRFMLPAVVRFLNLRQATEQTRSDDGFALWVFRRNVDASLATRMPPPFKPRR